MRHPWVFLSGPMGSGKTTVGEELARQLQLPFVDLDAFIAGDQRRSIAELFRQRGEAAFRHLESEALQRLLDELPGGVLALGGGTVTDAGCRRLLLDRGLLITLQAMQAELSARLQGCSDRPLLAEQDVEAVLARLLEARADAYAECHAEVQTSGKTPAAVALEVARLLDHPPIAVPLGRRTYRIEIGSGVRRQLPQRLAAHGAGEAVLLVSDENVGATWVEPVSELLQSDRRVQTVLLPPGEPHKHLGSLQQVWDAALGSGIDRSATVLALGGGVVGDVAGFAASTLLRGLRLVQMPTTLLAMVDSSVGGKTAIDRPQGKNLVGTFHQPAFVLCDLDFLQTLPHAERLAGLAEVVKSAWLDSETAVQGLEADAEMLVAGDAAATERAVRLAVTLKARIVAADEHEAGTRRLLNFGHTLGHAIEAATGYGSIRHGEAVSLGMLAAFQVAKHAGLQAEPHASRLRALLARLHLPTDLQPHWGSHLLPFLKTDKKRLAADVHFILPQAPGETRIQPVAFADLQAWLSTSKMA